ncbi:phenylacetate-CoA oxygenase subunit PaaI [Virgibacillus profundi]|uniref:Phenylacetate-CoA oxygenase subunit PaaI n=1 Tax=Virgibacillus profundi TaxID=2024555 RepID=A0A2A2ICP1_9BACI|nr:1,2-phenylacetyl-CoA epoxidase subunit PaaC [Virgibacillus profundi]PAV28905.1 phenylacetate-CoA oxygenase subunit PaaI [Virgibacillus profundi]PXY53073.1 phenylacetate-CoA oxygenase subunit PaaI [Virgibacillus profundi]
MTKRIETADEAKQDAAYSEALKELIYQMADDDFIVSFRGSEWLGLAPHIEEDVAFSSITQNTMGHAVMYYNLLEELGEGDADALAHARPLEKRRNAVYLEKQNGDGSYLKEPYFDWALTVVRHYFYEVLKKVKLEALTKSSYVPLANIAQKVLMEQPYHLAHWKLWIRQLQNSNEDAKSRINMRIVEAWKEFGDALELGTKSSEMVQHELIAGEEFLQKQWLNEVKATVMSLPTYPLEKGLGNGRNGKHSADLKQAIKIFSEVYESDREAVW